jgi:prephenate dehydrogenase
MASVKFGRDTMMDYLRLIDEAVSFIETHPLAGSPTISQMENRRVKLTSHKQYQIHYDFDEAAAKAIIVAVFK